MQGSKCRVTDIAKPNPSRLFLDLDTELYSTKIHHGS
jgi:hypothetical protein